MKWFKHITDSADDPDIDDAITLFGVEAYYVFFRTLEVMSREFDEKKPGIVVFSEQFFRKKFHISYKKVLKVLEFYSERGRIFIEISNGKRLSEITLNCPKLKDLCDEYAKRKVRTKSEQTPKPSTDKIPPQEEDKDKDKDKEIDKEREKREEKFRTQLKNYYKKPYSGEMLKEFFEYWTEPNKSRTLMRFELETTWDLKKRLARWDKNNGKFTKNTGDFGDHNTEFTEEEKAEAEREKQRLIKLAEKSHEKV